MTVRIARVDPGVVPVGGLWVVGCLGKIAGVQSALWCLIGCAAAPEKKSSEFSFLPSFQLALWQL